MPKSKQQIDTEVAMRGLVSIMNDTKWRELQKAVRAELPFAPPYQLKVVLNPHPEPEQFDADVHYLGDWSDECLSPFYEIEWIRIRARFLRRRGRLLAAEVCSVESEFLAILHRHDIPYRCDEDSIWIFGYVSSTGDLKRGQRTRRCSEREPADSLRDKFNVIGGWLPSLTFALDLRAALRPCANFFIAM
ncbi:MAG TPA: DUF6678 family protein [Verrucomicrobiae bacterium]|nr:DUF6678 family protein [Verrucomicrobiae bacterium]